MGESEERLSEELERAKRRIEDLTDRLQVAQRLESVGQLVGGIAHDLNNQLSVILNYATFAIGALPEGDQARADVEQVRAAGERAAAVTQHLLLFSRRAAATPEVVDPNGLISDLERLLRRSLGEQIRLVVSPAGNLPPVFADPHKLEQVVLNLAVNGRDAMQGGGTLEIATAVVDLDEPAAKELGLKPGFHVEVAVTDDGAGMSPEVAARAFEPGFSALEGRRSSGMGLATAKEIVSQAGGSISIDSEPGKGTTVRVVLPAVEPEATKEEASGDQSSASGGECVLVVEDELAVLELTRRILGTAGYKVLAATSAAEAIEACEGSSEAVRLLLSDMVLPEISGIDLARRLRELQPGMRVAFMTGYSREFLERHTNVGSAVAIVEKPFTTDKLLRGVRAALDAAPAELPPG